MANRNPELEKILKKVLLAQEKTNRTMILLGAGSYLTREEEQKPVKDDPVIKSEFDQQLKQEQKKNILFRDIRFLPGISKMTEIKRSSPGYLGAASFFPKLALAGLGGLRNLTNRSKMDSGRESPQEVEQEAKKAEENSEEVVNSLSESTDRLVQIEENTRLAALSLDKLLELNKKQYDELKLQSLAQKVRDSEGDADSVASAAAAGAVAGAAGAAGGDGGDGGPGGGGLGGAVRDTISKSLGKFLGSGAALGAGLDIGKRVTGYGARRTLGFLRGPTGRLLSGTGARLGQAAGLLRTGVGAAGSALGTAGSALGTAVTTTAPMLLGSSVGAGTAIAAAPAVAGSMILGSAALGGAAGYGLNKLGSYLFGDDEFNNILTLGLSDIKNREKGVAADPELLESMKSAAENKSESMATAKRIYQYTSTLLRNDKVDEAVELVSSMNETITPQVLEDLNTLNEIAIERASKDKNVRRAVNPSTLDRFTEKISDYSSAVSVADEVTNQTIPPRPEYANLPDAESRISELEMLTQREDVGSRFASRALNMVREENQRRVDTLSRAGIVAPTRTSVPAASVTATSPPQQSSANIISSPTINNQSNQVVGGTETSTILPQDPSLELSREKQGF